MTHRNDVIRYEEDPFLYQTKRGFHMLTRRAVKYAGGYCGGGHLYSTDLKTWFFGENVYGGSSKSDSAQCNINMLPPTKKGDHSERDTDARAGAGTGAGAGAGADAGAGAGVTQAELVQLQSRERPTLFTDTDGSRYLFTGAAVNVSMFVHSFTLMQQINLNAENHPVA